MADYNSTATSTVYVNGKPAEQELQRLKQRASDLQDAMAKAASAGNKADLKKFRSELTSTRREIKNVENSMHSAEVVMKRLNKATPRELNMALRQLKKELNDIERGSDAWNKQVAKIKRVKAELDSVNAEMREQQSVLSRLNDGFNRWGMSIASAAAALTGITMTVRQAVDAYAGMDQEMANVQKFTGMSKEEVGALNEEFKKIDTRTSREELNQLAQEAGRLGLSSQEDVLGFVRAADKINVALDDLGDGATLTLSKLTGIFGDQERYGTEQSLLKVGSVINELSQNCSASAPYLAEFASRMGGVGAQAGMSVQQIMGFAAVLDSNNQKVEASATALSQVITRLYQDPAKYAKVAGLDVANFTKLLKEDANAAVLQLLETLNQKGGLDSLAPMFKDMGENGARAISALSTLATHIDEVKSQQEVANQAFDEGLSIQREFDVQNNTVQAGLDKAKNQFHEMAVELGEKLAPAARYAITGTSALMKTLSLGISFVSRNKAAFATLAVTIAAATIAVNAQTIALKAMYAWDVAVAAGKKALNVIMGTGKVVSLALAAAYNAVTGNAVRAAAATRALKLALASTGWGAIIAVVGTLATALVGLASRTRETSSTVVRSIDIMKKKQSEWASAVSSSVQGQLSQYYMLQKKWKECNGDVTLQRKFLKTYESQIYSVTGKVLGLVDAENIFVKKTNDVVAAIIARAEAEAGKKLYQEALERRLRNDRNGSVSNGRYYVNVHRELDHGRNSASGEEMQAYERATGKRAISGSGQSSNAYRLTPEAQRWIENRRKANANAIRSQDAAEEQYWLNYTLDAEKRSVAANKKAGINPGAPDSSPSGLGHGATGGGSAGGSSHGGSHGGGSHGGSHSGGSSKHEDKFAAEKAWRKQQEDQAKLDFALDILDQRGFNYRMSEIAQGYFSKLMANPKATSAEHLEAEANYYDEIKKYLKLFDDADLEDFEAAYKRSMADLTQQYIDNNISLEDFNRQSEALELDHLKKAVDKHKEGTKERLTAETAYQNALKQQHEREQQEMEDNYKKLYEQQQKMNELRLEYFGMSDEEKQQAYDTAVATLDAIYQQELKKVGDNNKKKLELERKYQSAKEKIRKGIFDGDDLGDGQNAKSWDQWTGTWLDKAFGEGTWEKYGDVVKSGVASIGNIYKGLTSLVEAEEQKKLQAMTKKYDAEIKAAEGNQYRINQIQKRKEAEEKRIKDASNKRAMAMELAQAMSTTALAAINAYSSAAKIPLTGWILAPVAAGLALAAGAVQIAAIRKQHQVQSQGYSGGGYTRPGAKDEPAGIVHAGEWVASQKLLASPVARPMIEFLDHAQRTNTIGRLAMPSSPIRSGASSVLAPTQPVVVTESQELRDTIRQLNKRLNEPFVTINTVAGDHGIKQAQDEYKKLMNNTLPKNKRT